MVNYANGKIYKIEPLMDHDEGDIYIGSTTKNLLCQRMETHRGNYRLWKNGKNSKVMSFDIFDKYGLENCVITLLETVNANSKDELQTRERYYIQSLKCVNKNIPMRTIKEWYEDNKEQKKQYYENNKDVIFEKKKQYYENNKDKVLEQRKQYNDENRDKRLKYLKQYREDKKDIIIEYQKQYHEKNKDKLLEKALVKFECECGASYLIHAKQRHFRSQKHLKYIESKK
jgi:hypothetical protein